MRPVETRNIPRRRLDLALQNLGDMPNEPRQLDGGLEESEVHCEDLGSSDPQSHVAGHMNEDTQADFTFNDLVYTTLPPDFTPDVKLSDDPNGWTQCLLRRPVLNDILSTPGFPSAPHFPSELCFRIGPSKNGLGMFATRDLSMGDHILTERPLMVTPTCISMPNFARRLAGKTDSQRSAEILNEWEKRFLRPCFMRMDPEAQAAFLDLANSHTQDGSGPILGIIRTNGFEVANVVDPEPNGEYAAVCKIMCRINHR